ncbi:FadR/GntR family transcriptional regulator [Aestuariimicrobium soli]|uniref:FadR/GntR family transcriptional regulator n=1 Tax=Aestuariimicrobium soli TaxID=2035834 RepID=UPI003EBD21CE
MAVTDDAIEAIRTMIATGELKPGDRLPREADLAASLGLSRSSLREAVKALALIRVLDVRRGDGTFVAALEPASLVDVMGFVTDLHQDSSVLQFLQVRRLLEPEVTALAATEMAAADREALLGSVDELDDLATSASSAGEVDRLVTHDLEFHRRIAETSGNPLVVSLLDAVSGRTQRARVWRGITEHEAVGRTVREHREIARAILAGDAQAARAWATVHIAGVEQWLRRSLDSAADGSPV